MRGKRNVSVCSGHELANALYVFLVPMRLHVASVSGAERPCVENCSFSFGFGIDGAV